MLNRKQQPPVKTLDTLSIAAPERNILPNGISLNTINAGEQEVTRMDILIGAGQWHQSQPLQAMFTNRMLREGTMRFSSGEIAEKLDYYGAWLELSSSVKYSYITLYSLNKYFSQTVDILESIVKEPVFPTKELSLVAQNNKQQYLVNRTKVDVISRKLLNQALLGTQHPCARFADEKDYDLLAPDLLADYYKRYYHSANCSIYLAGKVTPEITAEVEAAFGKASWGNIAACLESPVFNAFPLPEKRIFKERPDALQSSVRLGALSCNRTSPDYHKLKVLVTLFGGYFGSRLMSNIREDKGYTYGIGAGLSSFGDTGVLVIGTETANEHVDKVIREVYHEIDRLQNEVVPDEELSIVKNYMVGELSRAHEGPFSLSDSWIYVQTNGLDKLYIQHALKGIQTVTSGEIKELARKYLDKESLKEIIVGKKM